MNLEVNGHTKGDRLEIVFLGLTVTSSWGNGHATNYRGLMKALTSLGHNVVFLERDMPWYASHRDLPAPPYGRTDLYGSTKQLFREHSARLTKADAVIVGSYVPEGIEVCRWVLETAQGISAFWDIDTPITLAGLARGECEYLNEDLAKDFDLYLSFTGGPALTELSERYGVKRPLGYYCSVDAGEYFPVELPFRWDLGYLGTYSPDRQPGLEQMIILPALERPDLRFVVAGSMYPEHMAWPRNVERIEHLPPSSHREFYASQRFSLNVTRQEMKRWGWSPSVRLFEAAACATPVISDRWPGLEAFFRPDVEIVTADKADDVLDILERLDMDNRAKLGDAARTTVLERHTSRTRAAELSDLIRATGLEETMR